MYLLKHRQKAFAVFTKKRSLKMNLINQSLFTFPIHTTHVKIIYMIITTHQPIFLPWPGFFYKAMKADYMVLLDNVQYPRGRGWINRNRLKCDKGELWLTVPVHKKGRGLQLIRDVEIFDKVNWIKKHLQSIRHNYTYAPYFREYYPAVEKIYTQKHSKLLPLNLEFIRFLWDALFLPGRLLLQSELGITGKGTELLINICRYLQADTYLVFTPARKHLNVEDMRKHGINTIFIPFHPPIYPQLWGDFIYNLSTLDLLLNCGNNKSRKIISNTY